MWGSGLAGFSDISDQVQIQGERLGFRASASAFKLRSKASCKGGNIQKAIQ